ncbi:hypothetical protein MSG28_003102 [Choristoneura fumiferana]|uniref:Uncharacterized protein n=1 Tax=Choristoneura fumiferana TaxID=7141 RepID=A0ACC0KEB8_CHOFU|nr:hypothetical protein MSG28_003102 [Choristoneura fumiferana]
MAVAAQKSVASLMRKTLDRQAAVARVKFRFKERQVENIIVNYVKDKSFGPYGELVKVLQDYPLTDENFKILIEDCLSCVVLLGRDMKQFVDILCNVQWASRSQQLVELYIRFLLSLLTAHTYHCPLVLTNLVKKFRVEGENWDEHPPSETVAVWSNIHTIIAQIVAIMPMTSDLLMQTVIEQFPYYKAGCYCNRAYIHNLIWMSKYIPSLREHIVTAIVSRMVEMDSNIVDRAKNKNQSELIFEMETDEQDELSVTLDYCMLEMLRWLEEERDPALVTICNVFERVVLPTHGINAPTGSSATCGWWRRAGGGGGCGGGHPAHGRGAPGGLLARCVRVPNSRLVQHLRAMAEWCHGYITATQESTSSDNTKVHGAFHAICHAVSRAFAGVTRAHQVAYCQAILDRNARHQLHAHAAPDHLEHWFPSGKTIWPLCIEYKDWGKDGEDNQYSGMKRKLEPEEDDFLSAASPQQKLANSLSNFRQ